MLIFTLAISYLTMSNLPWFMDLTFQVPMRYWYFKTVVLEKTFEILLDYKEIKSVNSKGSQLWICIARTDAEAEAPILWPPDAKSRFMGKTPDARKDLRQKEKRVPDDQITIRKHHWFSGHESEQTSGDSERQGSLACFIHEVKNSWTQLSDWMITILMFINW